MSTFHIPRRAALIGAAGSLAFRPLKAPAQVASEAGRPQAIWGASAGDVTADRALIWSRADRVSRMIVEWSTDEGFRNATRVTGPFATEATDFTTRLDLTGLPPDAEIFYRVTFAGPDAASGNAAPVLGRFRTAPLSRRDVRFLWSGDTNGQGWGIDEARGGFRTYEAMRRNGGDFFIHCGDTIYADSPVPAEIKMPDGSVWRNLTTPETNKVAETLAEYRGRHRYNLLDKNVRAFHSEIAQLWMWDDHEVTNNWSSSKVLPASYTHEKRIQALRANATQAFWDYAPIRPHGSDEINRVYRKLAYGPHLDVFALDMRSYRGPNGYNREEQAGPDTAFLGQAQVNWLLRGLLASKATWKVIAADMPIGIGVPDGKDTQGRPAWEAIANGNGPALGREIEIAQLLSAIKHGGVKNVVWVTADVHYTAAHHYHPERAQYRDFNPFWEFVSGPLQAGTFGPNPPDDTFGIEVVFSKDPGGRENLSPAEGMQFFGECAIEGRSGALNVMLKDMTGATLWNRVFEPERA
jgi:alkaline phosphatase D